MTSPGRLPPGFRFGVATAGFQVEGGFNGPLEPRNNWYEWEAAGRVEPSGLAIEFWERYDLHLDRAQSLGIDSFRLSVEWARLEPREGEFDEDAFARYATILKDCRARGMEPFVTLCHFTHPAWLGSDFWCNPESPERFARYASEVTRRLGHLCTTWVTLNEINILALMSFFLGSFPPGGRLDVRRTLAAADHLLAAHVLAYGEIRKAWPEAVVGTNNCSLSVYELDRIGTDLLLARSRGVPREDIGRHLRERRARWYAAVGGTRQRPRLEAGLRRL
ncbi:MAG: family 1 glycosylhydrolase, partial [Acidimicrobiales bacterium]